VGDIVIRIKFYTRNTKTDWLHRRILDYRVRDEKENYARESSRGMTDKRDTWHESESDIDDEKHTNL
jgi:hypothetical protein